MTPGHHRRDLAEQPGHPDVRGAADSAGRHHGQQRVRPEAAREEGHPLPSLQAHLPLRRHRRRRLRQGDAFLWSYEI